MNAASTGPISVKAAPPSVSSSCASGRSASGAWATSGPCAPIGAMAMASAIMMPPQAMSGTTYETPVRRYCLCWCNEALRDANIGDLNGGVIKTKQAAGALAWWKMLRFVGLLYHFEHFRLAAPGDFKHASTPPRRGDPSRRYSHEPPARFPIRADGRRER